MKKHKILLPIVCVLMAAIVMCSFGFLLNSRTPSTSYSNEQYVNGNLTSTPGVDNSVATLFNQSPVVSFKVTAAGKLVNIDALYSVVDGIGNPVSTKVSVDGNNYVISPDNSLNAGTGYSITLAKGLTFVDYSGVSQINFRIARIGEVEDVTLREGVVTIISDNNFVKDNGSVLNLKDVKGIKTGDILVSIGAFGSTSYKITAINANSLSYSIPELDEVYETLDVNKSYTLTEADFDNKRFAKDVGNMDVIKDLAKAGFGAPEFGFNVAMDGQDFLVDITLTFTDLIPDWKASSTLVLSLKNRISPKLVYSLGKDMASTFQLGTEVTIKTTTGISVSVSDSGYYREGMEAIVEKLGQITNKDYKSNVRLFTGVVPIGTTGLTVNYDLDGVFAYNFAGDMNLTVDTTVTAETGITVVKGKITPYSNTSFSFDKVNFDLYGQLNVKVGIAQTLGVSILNIVEVGICADLGNYNDLYGMFKAEYTHADMSTNIGGTIYLEGGFYYSIDLKAGLRLPIPGIPPIENINVNLANGKIKLYELGDQYFDFKFTSDNDEIVLNSFEMTLPSFYVNRYNVVDRQSKPAALSFDQLAIIQEANSNIVIENNVIKVVDAKLGVDEIITVNYVDGYNTLTKKAHIVMPANKPMLASNFASFDKANDDSVAFNVIMNGANLLAIEGNEISVNDYNYDVYTGSITINKDYLIKLVQGVREFKIVTSANELAFTIDVSGKLDLFSYGEGTQMNPYKIFARDQFIQLVEESANNNFAGVYFALGCNVNMADANGESFAMNSIKEFNGTLIGNSFAVANINVNGRGLVAVNNGNIGAIEFKNINVNGVASQSSAGIIAGDNNGNIIDVVVSGSINAKTTKGNMNVGGIAGYNAGVIKNAIVKADIIGSSDLDVPGRTIYIGGIAGKNAGTIELSSQTGARETKVDNGTGITIKNNQKNNDVAN